LSRFEIRVLAAMTALSVVTLAVLGRFAPQIMHDTGGYLAIVGFPEMLTQPRAPLYGWIVAALDLGRGTFVAVPAVQIATYLAAVWLCVAQLRRYGLSPAASLSVGAALLFANALLIDSGWIAPELPAITCALLAVAATVELALPRPRWWSWLAVCTAPALAYIMRPNFLPLIVTLPVLFLCLRAMRREPLRPTRAALILAVAALPFLAISTMRAAVVGDFNLVSFGGFTLSGMATLMLSDDVVARLPDDLKPYAADVLAKRRAGEESGRMIGIPLSSSGVRSFHSVTLGYYDVIARTYDDMLYEIIAPTQAPNEDWVAFNRRLMRFSLAVIRAAPDRYAAWVVGGATRMAGRAVVTNLPAMLALIVVAVAWPWRLFATGEIGIAPASRLDFPVMIVLGLLWLVGAGALTILASQPGTRYVDTSSLLLAPPLITWAALLLMPGARDPVNVNAPPS
jgi:hypothetical protein